MNFASSIAAIFAALLGLWNRRSEQKDTPDIKANEVAKQDAKVEDQINQLDQKAIAGDAKALEELRRGIS